MKPNLSDYFTSTYVINLPERKDRLRDVTRELEGIGMPLSAGKVELVAATKPKEKLGFPSIGARGCFLSHLDVLTRAAEKSSPNILVVEDDLVVSSLVNRHLAAILAEFQSKPWGIAYLGHLEAVPDSVIPRMVPLEKSICSSHFYAVNGPVIPRLFEYLDLARKRQPGDPRGGPMHLDGALSMFRQANKDVLTLIAHPNLGSQRSSRSDITCSWYERAPVLKQAADLARSVRNSFRS